MTDLPVPDEEIDTSGDADWETDADSDEDLVTAATQASASLESDPDAEELPGQAGLPVVAIVGRPNVGKSTLVNRIVRRRAAVVEDTPGVTRDRVRYPAEWGGRDFILLDTGGWDRKGQGRAAAIKHQAEAGIADADVIVFVVDATVGPTAADEDVVPLLRASGKPVLLVANKADDADRTLEAASLWSLGLGEPYAVSALHGRGSGDLLDHIVAALPEHGKYSIDPGIPRVALVGKPNVGKSSLLNKLAGQDRVVVHNEPGTTVDPVDEQVQIGGRDWLLIDTAGIRRKAKEASGHEYYASVRSKMAIDRADVVIMVLDSSETIAEQDLRLIQLVIDAGRALVIAFNKWDLVDEERRPILDREIDLDLDHVAWAPRVNVSALTGRRVQKLADALDIALGSWQTRISTGRLNTFFREVQDEHPHPVRGGKQPRIMFGTQATTRPPTFVLFTTGFLEAGYRRFLERRLRETFEFIGTPIVVNLRIRKRKERRGRGSR